jgi:hypothetical protein
MSRRSYKNIVGLACRGRTRQAPFERIAACQSEFIAAEYLPAGVTITDPRSMKLDVMLKFFEHIAEREKSHGVTQAFRFKAILSSRKKGSILPAHYKDDGVESGDNEKSGPAPAPAPTQPLHRKRPRSRTQAAGGGSQSPGATSPDPIQMIDPTLMNEPADLNSITAQGVQYHYGLNPTSHAGVRSIDSRGPSPPSPTGLQTPGNTPAIPTDNVPDRILTTEQLSTNEENTSAPTGLYTPEKSPAPPTNNNTAPTGLYTPEESPAPPSQNDTATDNPPVSGTTRPEQTHRRKSKTSTLLAIEEGLKYGTQGKRRR